MANINRKVLHSSNIDRVDFWIWLSVGIAVIAAIYCWALLFKMAYHGG